ncbi:signal peptide peptidase A. Serine peptidase. MEROPS family S49 [Desulfacinum hydrothermale DSM 13146]|uniref:Signal peptide peptidase A. Serine peptidase. MEROPS family S49 n=1 Tax=Desulfacinum hydrothermale DSM 13146 TaxID=1121390 RepID=A0A1W1XN17_9BACT|nr:signal peptide peptidase SppA [Desulfacinum hydrothermale]SMC24908.1 signal peptide peptidase A. Serine peptidase. MEROPS family S49 [Desulfacinum hydrothermale DSM 13146]
MKVRKIFWFLIVLLIFFLFPFVALMVWFAPADWDWMASPNRVGVVEVEGVIKDARPVLEALVSFRRDPNVRAIVVRIESPGGGVGASQEIYREVRRTDKVKPVVASLGGVAASGGYYVASGARTIIANPGTLTGSIGVVAHLPNLASLFQKVGYRTVTIKSGRFKDVGNPGREMTEEERALLQETMDTMHAQFIRDVAEGRGLDVASVKRIADGRILSGEAAFKYKLVDELGNFQDAVAKAAELGEIQGEPHVVYAEKKRTSLLQWILGKSGIEGLRETLDPALNPLRYQLILSP